MKTFVIINGLEIRYFQGEAISQAATSSDNFSDHSKEVIIREIEPKIKYYLFGEDAVRIFNDEGIKKFVKWAKSDDCCGYGTFTFIDGVTDSLQLVEAIDGWMDYAILDLEDFEKIPTQE